MHGEQPQQKEDEKEGVKNVIGNATVKNGRLALRVKPEVGGALMVYMPDKAEVDILEIANGEWFKVQYDKYTGYAMKKFLDYKLFSGMTAPNEKHYVRIQCDSKDEADTLAQLLKGAVVE